MRKNNWAFTLIELLIVIALLSSLAVGLLAAVDPFEQLKKGTDTSVSNLVSEIYNATIRHYANTANTPWTGATVNYVTMTTANASAMLSTIIAGGELKSDFQQLAGTGKLKEVSFQGIKSDEELSVAVCFQPASKSFQSNKNTQYLDRYGTTTSATCKSAGGTASCYWCVK